MVNRKLLRRKNQSVNFVKIGEERYLEIPKKNKQPGIIMRGLVGLGGAIVNLPKNWAARQRYLNSPEGMAAQAEKMKAQNKIIRQQVERNKLISQRNNLINKGSKFRAEREKALRDATRGLFG